VAPPATSGCSSGVGQVCKLFSPFICIYHAIQILTIKGGDGGKN
jgi:hypothetical protein